MFPFKPTLYYLESEKTKQTKSKHRIFIKWIKYNMGKEGDRLKNLTDLTDGVLLAQLYERLSGEKLDAVNPSPITRAQRIHNVQMVLNRVHQRIEEFRLGLMNDAQTIVFGKEDAIMGVLWNMIKVFILPNRHNEVSQEKFLLLWVNQIAKSYSRSVNNFGEDFKDGVVFNLLLREFDNKLVNHNELNTSPRENCARAFAVGEKLGIMPVLTIEDVVEIRKPEERGVILWVSMMYNLMKKKPVALKKMDASKLRNEVREDSERMRDFEQVLLENEVLRERNVELEKEVILLKMQLEKLRRENLVMSRIHHKRYCT